MIHENSNTTNPMMGAIRLTLKPPQMIVGEISWACWITVFMVLKGIQSAYQKK